MNLLTNRWLHQKNNYIHSKEINQGILIKSELFCRIQIIGIACPVLSAKSITGGCAGIDRRPCINSEGGLSAPEDIAFKMKTGWV